MGKTVKNIVLLLIKTSIILIQGFFAHFVWTTYYNPMLATKFYWKGNTLVVFLFIFLLSIFSKLFDSLNIRYNNIFDIIYSSTIATLATDFSFYIILCLIFGAVVSGLPIVFLFFASFVADCIWSLLITKTYSFFFPPSNLLLIYDERNPEFFLKKFKKYSFIYTVNHLLNIEDGFDKIGNSIDLYDGVIIYDMDAQKRNDILKLCFEKNKKCYIMPKLTDIIIAKSKQVHLFDTPLLETNENTLSISQRFIKRSMDLVISFVALVILSPLFLIIAIAIKLEDHGSVFYKQDRITIDGKEFMIYKFRSMRESNQGEYKMTTINDSRVTKIGNILRRTHLDELPQLINIFLGEMSIVGPRPERACLSEIYEQEIPEFTYRLKVKAGLTGYAQVYGKYNTTPYDKLKLDLYYIENYSIFLDIMLIVLTVKVMFKKETSEGIEENQKNAIRN